MMMELVITVLMMPPTSNTVDDNPASSWEKSRCNKEVMIRK
jgi:hypothetical protein